MSKNQSSQNPSRSSCEKFRRSTFGRFRRPNLSLSSKSKVTHTEPMAVHRPVFANNEIPIESGFVSEAKPVKNFVRFSSDSVKHGGGGGGKEVAGQKTFGEAKFDSFIGRMKKKMSAPSDVGKADLRNDSFHDKVSGFIDRTKLKMRATSSMGANGKTVSFK